MCDLVAKCIMLQRRRKIKVDVRAVVFRPLAGRESEKDKGSRQLRLRRVDESLDLTRHRTAARNCLLIKGKLVRERFKLTGEISGKLF
jgi:hypothetical protein